MPAFTNEELIQELISEGYLKTPHLIDAFRAVDRKNFIPTEYRDEAYGNYPLPIGYGQTISQPLTVAFMLELLSPQPGEKILDIGTGSGWVAAILIYAASKNGNEELGRVISIERIKELSEIAHKNLGKYNFIERGILRLVIGDGSDGYEAEAPYDKIIAAAAGKKIPEAWKQQLKIDGKIVAPAGQNIVVVEKIGDDKFKQREHFGFSFVPLIKD